MVWRCAYCKVERPYADWYKGWLDIPSVGAVCPCCKLIPLDELKRRAAAEARDESARA